MGGPTHTSLLDKFVRGSRPSFIIPAVINCVPYLCPDGAAGPSQLSNCQLSSSGSIPPRQGDPQRNRTKAIPFFVVVLLSLFACINIYHQIPPRYESTWNYEKQLPQHQCAQTGCPGRTYIRFPDHLLGHGFNNVLQENILSAYLAYSTNRSLVFEDYIWARSVLPFTIYEFSLRPARMPLNAFIGGPMAGGATVGPLAINDRFWETVCPASERHVITSLHAPTTGDGGEIMDWWISRVQRASTERCVEIDSSERPAFDTILFGGSRMVSLWERLSGSPILKDFAWSPLVQSAVSNNLPLLLDGTGGSSSSIDPKVLPGWVAVHVRRGDYSRHCYRLESWNASYLGVNQLPGLSDTFDAGVTQDRRSYYLKHCLPSVPQIVERLREVRSSLPRPTMANVYILSNAGKQWVGNLRTALIESGWKNSIKTSFDLVLDAEQRHVGMAVDMAFAERAEFSLGTGFVVSTLAICIS
ncbi:hypothetical protein BD779DRAFT_1671103 [Infundibulicybe gibba]|nr:hypothetical protein BD779DRAFT_1671103 [Infundibulicybe gibba]